MQMNEAERARGVPAVLPATCEAVSPMIKLENVTKVYKGEVVALRDAEADIQKGEFVFLVGASGSGKSTMLRLMNREETPDKGRVWVAGKDIADLSSWKDRKSVV